MRVLLLLMLLLFTPRSTSAGPERLRRDLDGIVGRFHGKLGYSLHHLRTGDRLERRGDEKFPTASTIKLAILCAAMEKQQKGEIGYDETRTFTRDDRQDGTGLLQHYREGTRVGLRELLHLMITQSDNTATEILCQWLGADCVNRWLDRHALKNTRLLIPWPYRGTAEQDLKARPQLWEPVRQWGMGVTTPNEMRRLMEMIASGQAGTPAACDEMLRILNHQFYDDRIASQVPPWVGVASKHGTEGRSRSDVALVHSPSGDYFLAVYTREASDTGAGANNEQDTAIRAISRAVWRYYHPRLRWSPPRGVERFYDVWPRVDLGPDRAVTAPPPRGAPIPAPMLVEGFEGGTLLSRFGTSWTTYTDRALGGTSTVEAAVVDGGANGSRKALRLTGRVTTDTDFHSGFAGISLLLDSKPRGHDVTALRGVRFYARGDGGRYQLAVLTTVVQDGNEFGKEFVAPPEWTRIDVPFSQLQQSPYFGRQRRWTGTDVRGIQFGTAAAPLDAYVLQVDEVSFY